MILCNFDPTPRLWLTSLGLAGIIGFALWVNARSESSAGNSPEFWPAARLFLVPFCVSSFTALVKNKGFVLVLSPRLNENLLAAAVCGLFFLSVSVLKSRSMGTSPRLKVSKD